MSDPTAGPSSRPPTARIRPLRIRRAPARPGPPTAECVPSQDVRTRPPEQEQVRTRQLRAGAMAIEQSRPSQRLRAPADSNVLEVGAGCGPITRYLGETGAQIDALEPVLPRARVARERTRDLGNVEVFCGNFEDVPPDPVYDLVIVVGVLEYVGGGEAEPEPYLGFLRECRTRLRPGGCLVLAIENKLGVKYLTGTGEDHSGRIFHSVEDYPRLGPARTFSSTALLDMMTACDFSPRLFGVFPDYKTGRRYRVRACGLVLPHDSGVTGAGMGSFWPDDSGGRPSVLELGLGVRIRSGRSPGGSRTPSRAPWWCAWSTSPRRGSGPTETPGPPWSGPGPSADSSARRRPSSRR